MILAKVTGTVISTQKDENLNSLKLLLCRELDSDQKLLDTYHVAVDAVKAGQGDIVLLASGSSARMTNITRNAPIDAVTIAIVDNVSTAKV
ncbi:MAG: EutN/CcmL family microcompartment protein [Phycisphaerae bacterium]|nr:EutN/CcmL family microcompartment protein [Phycisphaerae bacterium]